VRQLRDERKPKIQIRRRPLKPATVLSHPEPPKGATGSPTAEIPLSDGAQTVIGRFRLLEKIGEGGFGVVLCAEQKTPVRRRVAAEDHQLGMDTRSVVGPLRGGAEALAMMDHPNIAKVLTRGNRHRAALFVMELVRGIPITDYCDQNNFDAGFSGWASSSTFAMPFSMRIQKGVIHRDIKPSNILGDASRGVPIPKVIDFGHRQGDAGDLTDKTIYTQFQAVHRGRRLT